MSLNREDRHEDRIIWALRFYKKALIEQLLRMTRILSSTRRKPQIFKKRFGSFPAARQRKLRDELQKLAAVDITLFQYETGPDNSRYLGSRVIYEINRHISHFLQIADIYGKNVPDNVISHLPFKEQPFGEIVLSFRLCEFDLKSDIFEKETIPEEDLCIIRVQDENYEGRGCTEHLSEPFMTTLFHIRPKRSLCSHESGELKRKSVIKLKPSFPFNLTCKIALTTTHGNVLPTADAIFRVEHQHQSATPRPKFQILANTKSPRMLKEREHGLENFCDFLDLGFIWTRR